MATAKRKKTTRARKVKKHVSEGIVYIQSTFNNTIVTVTDKAGNVLSWSSAGHLKFKGSRKSTPYAAQMVARDAMLKAKNFGVSSVRVMVKGPGTGRESALRAVASVDVQINEIRDITPIPHNGCRPPKRRRV
jgi:small subunit ribosomal protein S11